MFNGIGKYRTGEFGGFDGGDASQSNRLGLRSHARVLEFREPRPRVVLEPLVIGQHAGRLFPIALSPQNQRGTVIGGAQVWIQLHGFPIPLQRFVRLTHLQQHLPEVVSGIGILRIGCRYPAKMRQRRGGFAEVQTQQPGDIIGPDMTGLIGEHLVDDGERRRIIAFQLAVQRGNRKVDPGIGPPRVFLDQRSKGLVGRGIVEMTHLGDTAVIHRDLFGTRPGGLPFAGVEQDQPTEDQRNARCLPAPALLHCFAPSLPCWFCFSRLLASSIRSLILALSIGPLAGSSHSFRK